MSGSGTPLARAELKVEKGQAALDKVEEVLQTIEKVQAAGKGTRMLVRTLSVVIVASLVALGVVVLVVSRKQAPA